MADRRARRRGEAEGSATPPRAEEDAPRDAQSGSAEPRRRRGRPASDAADDGGGWPAGAYEGERGAQQPESPSQAEFGGMGGVHGGASRRRRRQLDLSGVQPASAASDLAPGAQPPGALPLWSRGDRQPLLGENALLIDAEDVLREGEGGVSSESALPAATLGLAGAQAGAAGPTTSRYAEDPVHGGFVRALDAPPPPDGGEDTLLTSRQLAGDPLFRLTSRFVVAVLTIARGLLAGISLLHLFLIAPVSSFALPTPFVVYAPLALSAQSIFQALITISLVAVLDAHVMYTPSASASAGATAVVAASGGRGLVVSTGGSDGTRLILALYVAALLLGTLQTPIDHTLYYKYAVNRLGVNEATGAPNAEPNGLISASLVQWDVPTSAEADLCRFGLVTCPAFTRERALLYRSLGIARDTLCIAAFFIASIFFAASPPAARAVGARTPAVVPVIHVRPAGGTSSRSPGVAMAV